MSLYRQPGRYGARPLAAAAVAAFAAGALIAFFAGRATAPEPTLAEQVAVVRGALQPARQGIEILPNEYRQAVRAGGASSPAELAGVKAGVKRIQATVRARRADLVTLDAGAARRLDDAVEALAAAVESGATPEQVRRQAESASAGLETFLSAP